MKILLVTSNFNSLTGSELYYYELSRELKNLGHDVSLMSNIGNLISEKAINNGVKLFNFSDPPKEIFDIINFSHTHIFNHIINNNFFKNIPIIQTCQSEIIPVEFPITHPNIRKYVGIRKTIVDNVKKSLNTECELIMNPIDFNRFNNKISSKKDIYLFVGTIDNLRINALMDTYHYCKENNKKLIIVGRNDYPNIINNNLGSFVEIHNPKWDIEYFLNECDTVVGILLGRTSLEGLCSNKISIQYDIDGGGNILSKETKNINDYNINDFDSKIVAKKIIKLYESVL